MLRLVRLHLTANQNDIKWLQMWFDCHDKMVSICVMRAATPTSATDLSANPKKGVLCWSGAVTNCYEIVLIDMGDRVVLWWWNICTYCNRLELGELCVSENS